MWDDIEVREGRYIFPLENGYVVTYEKDYFEQRFGHVQSYAELMEMDLTTAEKAFFEDFHERGLI